MCVCFFVVVVFFKKKTAYEMRISDWSSDVCSSDLGRRHGYGRVGACDRAAVHVVEYGVAAARTDHSGLQMAAMTRSPSRNFTCMQPIVPDSISIRGRDRKSVV